MKRVWQNSFKMKQYTILTGFSPTAVIWSLKEFEIEKIKNSSTCI